MQADIFCRVVDNYGDIGVCWRLARRLAHGRGWGIRLWVDDLVSFAHIQPGIDPKAAIQTAAGVHIVHWTPTPDPALQPQDVVIEAFACDPPDAFMQAMRRTRPVWVNLEYLSAESWIESCHGLPSQRPDGLIKHFFFPGFTAATGGLIREPDLSAKRDALQSSQLAQFALLGDLGVSDAGLNHLRDGARLVTLFCYPTAPIEALAQALASNTRPTLLVAPEGVALQLEAAVGTSTHVQLARLPFVSQPEFDRLLWCADLNFVRGEDSFVRAAWAGRPLVWQIYPQDENIHLEKLDAWLARYPAPADAQALIRAWNQAESEQDFAGLLGSALSSPTWEDWLSAARQWDQEQAGRPDLANNLADFCAELAKKG